MMVPLGFSAPEGGGVSAVAIHPEPVWRSRADFIIQAHIDPSGTDVNTEQLWARRLGDNAFEVCCVPFFVYDVALGDVVETDTTCRFTKVVEHSRRSVFRVYFGRSMDPDSLFWEQVELAGGLVEWSGDILLAIDVASSERASAFEAFLAAAADAGELIFEIGSAR